MKNVLVTGGAGFIGSNLVDSLIAEGNWQVTVVDDFNDFYSPELKRGNVREHLNDPNYSLFEIDICDAENLRAVFEERDFDVIVHLAARAGVRPSLEQPVLYNQANVGGTLNLLELAREFAVPQFVFGSSSSVYGLNCETPFRECSPISRPMSPYAATKAAGELLCHTYSHLYGIRIVCLRFFTVYGARQRPDLAIHKFTRQIYEEKPIELYGDGTTRRDYTYIDDILAGIRAAMSYAETPFEIFNLGEARAIQLNELIALLENNLGKRAIVEHCPMQSGDMPETFADISKAGQMLDYNPITAIETGIEKFVEWFVSNEKKQSIPLVLPV
jgi:UDP-glucuronate 4-epimerase